MLRVPRRQLGGGCRGFTLIELVVLMVIIAIIASAVAPAVGRPLAANRDRAAVREVIAALTTAHAKAVSEGRLVRLILAPQEGAIYGQVQTDPTLDRSQFDVLPLLGRDYLAWPSRLTLSALAVDGVEGRPADGAVIYCFPDGRTSGASLYLEGAGGQSFQIDLSPATGRVQISA